MFNWHTKEPDYEVVSEEKLRRRLAGYENWLAMDPNHAHYIESGYLCHMDIDHCATCLIELKIKKLKALLSPNLNPITQLRAHYEQSIVGK